jgi:hypothetical protein
MADELNVPTHRWYQPRNHINLAKEDYSKQWIYDSGIQKIDAFINAQPWGPLIEAVIEPSLGAIRDGDVISSALSADIDDPANYRSTGGAIASAALTVTVNGVAALVLSAVSDGDLVEVTLTVTDDATVPTVKVWTFSTTVLSA